MHGRSNKAGNEERKHARQGAWKTRQLVVIEPMAYNNRMFCSQLIMVQSMTKIISNTGFRFRMFYSLRNNL
jgi:hypothetical protein